MAQNDPRYRGNYYNDDFEDDFDDFTPPARPAGMDRRSVAANAAAAGRPPVRSAPSRDSYGGYPPQRQPMQGQRQPMPGQRPPVQGQRSPMPPQRRPQITHDTSQMMRQDSYKSMRSGSLDSLGDSFEDEFDSDFIPDDTPGSVPVQSSSTARPSAPNRPRPTKAPAEEDFLADEQPDFVDESALDDFADDFDSFGSGAVVTGYTRPVAQSLDQYRASRPNRDYAPPEPVVSRPAAPARPAARPSAPQAPAMQDDFDSGFEDDFDMLDDFVAAADADGFEDDFDNTARTIERVTAPSGRPAPPSARPAPPSARPAPPRRSSYNGELTAEQRELVAQRPEGMPEFYAQFLVGGAADDRRRSKSASLRRAKFKRYAVFGAGIAAVAGLAIAALVYFTSIPRNPIEVRSGIDEVDTSVLYSMLKSSVDDKLEDETVTIDVNGTPFTMNLADYDFSYAVPGTAEKSYVDIFSGSEIIETQTLISDGSLICNETKVQGLLTMLAATQGDTMIKPHYSIDGDKLTVYSGTNGVGIDYDQFMSDLKSSVRNGSNAVVADVHIIEAPPVDMDAIYAEVVCDPKDASTTTSSTGDIVFIDEIIGKDFDLAIAKNVVAAGGTSWTITLELTEPEISVVELRAPYCLDLLSSWHSSFNSASNKARASNIKLCADTINGTIIQPGEKFSFNNVVGKRTVEAGYSYATVYTSEGADSGVGGGICQVSSTLYYTSLLCNMYIPKAENGEEDGRRNHYYSVGYMDIPGTDATVSYPWPDLYIVNDKEYPVQIKMWVEGDNLYCEFWGTADGITCTIGYTNSNWTSYQTIYKHAADGKTNSNGAAGYTTTTRRNVFKDGVLISSKTEETSIYAPLNKVVYTNTLPPGASWSD